MLKEDKFERCVFLDKKTKKQKFQNQEMLV